MTPSARARRRASWVLISAVMAATGVGTACAEIGLGPNEAAAIELDPFPSPSVVVGDTLRNIDGVVAPVRARVFNVRGDVIDDAAPQYLYADFNIDSALAINSTTGVVIAKKLVSGDKRIAARIGGSLQVLRGLRIVTRPDSVNGASLTDILGTSLPDTGRRGLDANSTNDTMAAAYLIDDQGRASTIDTTDGSGFAGRRVRVRALQFPSGTGVDSVVVRATVTYKGKPLKGSPVRLAAAVRRGAR